MSKKPTIYLANPCGFSRTATPLLMQITVALEDIGFEVWEPFARNNQVDFTKPGWAAEIGRRDAEDVKNADVYFGIVNGVPPDDGVAIEMGIAAALGKPIFLFRDDFRRCADTEEYPINLMWFISCDLATCFYKDVESLSDPEKGLVKFIKGAAQRPFAAWYADAKAEVKAQEKSCDTCDNRYGTKQNRSHR